MDASPWVNSSAHVADHSFGPFLLLFLFFDVQMFRWERAEISLKLQSILDGPRDRIESLEFCEGHSVLISASWEGDVHLWDTATGLVTRSIVAGFPYLAIL